MKIQFNCEREAEKKILDQLYTPCRHISVCLAPFVKSSFSDLGEEAFFLKKYVDCSSSIPSLPPSLSLSILFLRSFLPSLPHLVI